MLHEAVLNVDTSQDVLLAEPISVHFVPRKTFSTWSAHIPMGICMLQCHLHILSATQGTPFFGRCMLELTEGVPFYGMLLVTSSFVTASLRILPWVQGFGGFGRFGGLEGQGLGVQGASPAVAVWCWLGWWFWVTCHILITASNVNPGLTRSTLSADGLSLGLTCEP